MNNYRWVLIFTLIILVFAAGCSKKIDPDPEIPVAIADPHLEQAIREQLEKPEGELTTADLARVVEIRVWGKEISDLSGLEHAVNLRALHLPKNAIQDLSPLAGMDSLEELNLIQNGIEDITPLSSLRGLKRLDLGMNRLKDISVVEWENLTGLQYLNIRYNYVKINDAAVREQIEALQDRGVEVLYEPMR